MSNERYEVLRGVIELVLALPYENPLPVVELEFDEEGELNREMFVAGSLHWLHYQLLVAEHDLITRLSQAQVQDSVDGDDTFRLHALASVGVTPIRELRRIEQFMVNDGFWDYEFKDEEDDG